MNGGLYVDHEGRRAYTPERLELEFSPAKWHAERQETLDRHHLVGSKAVEQWGARTNVRYGPGPLQTLDVFCAPNPQAPCCIILHGGFWRISDKAALNFIGGFFRSHGLGAIVANFDLCPAITIDEIVEQVRQLLNWVSDNPERLAINTKRLLLFGHATGAHLAAMLLARAACAPWQSKIRASLLVSGLYDIRQVPALSVNTVLRLDDAAALRNSPLLSAGLDVKAPVIMVAAKYETREFRSQSEDMWNMLRHWGVDAHYSEIPNCGHFTILDALLEPVCEAMNTFLRLSSRDTDSV